MSEKRGVEITLSKTPKGVIVLEGFPGLGVVATIATSFLIEHLKCEQIGRFHFEDKEVAPIVSIHKCKLIDPIGVYYSKERNLVIIHTITSPLYVEWAASDLVIEVCEQLKASELISIEGIGAPPDSKSAEPKAFYFTSDKKLEKKITDLGVACLGEGSIIGVTAALLEKTSIPHMCFFADTYSNLPDSRAAAKVIEVLDKYLELDVDYEPLLKQAKEFEERIKSIVEKVAKTQDLKEKKDLNYMG